MQSTATAVWTGGLKDGKGSLAAGNGSFSGVPYDFGKRFEGTAGPGTTPEELIAAAHSACFAMALSARLTQGGHPPEELTVRAVCTLDRVEGGYAITTMELDVRGKVPGIDEAAFQAAVSDAEKGCPVSKALAGNVAIRATGHLEQ